MERQFWLSVTLISCTLVTLFNTGPALAKDGEHFTTPAETISAAEDAFSKGDFRALAGCFDADGQKRMAAAYLIGFAAEVSEGSGPDVQKVKDMLRKYGITDTAKKGNETDEQLANRLAANLKHQQDFMVDATPLAFPNPNHKGPTKGELKDVKIDGAKAQATYSVKLSASDAMNQDVNFSRADGAWKITKAILFVSPE